MIKFFKVTALPDSPADDSIYFVRNGNVAEAYVTTSNGVALPVGNNQHIQSLIDASISALDFMEIVPTITARNQLVLGDAFNILVHVEDASGDLTAPPGPATYLWNKDTQTYIKLSDNVEERLRVIDGGNFQCLISFGFVDV